MWVIRVSWAQSGVCSFGWNFEWTHKNLEFRRHRMWSLNRQLQCKSVKIYRAQTLQYLALTKISAKRAHPRDQLSIGPDRYPSGSRVAHSFGSDKLYIVLSNKCFKCIQCICCGIDIRPSQDHRILRVQTVRINLASIYIWWLPKCLYYEASNIFICHLLPELWSILSGTWKICSSCYICV